jgi:hypothetical protein
MAVVRPDAHLDSCGRVRVYADAYFIRLRDVLREDFPTVARILGAERFERVAQEYVRAFPSEHPSVRHLGRSMAEFLEGRSDVPPYLGALARFEWAMIDVFDAADAHPITADSLREIGADRWPALRFAPIPALRVIHSGWPVHKLWSDDEPCEISAADTSLRIWRGPDYLVRHAVMDSREAEALKRFLRGEAFALICDAYSDLPEDEAAKESIATLAGWLAAGLIGSVT